MSGHIKWTDPRHPDPDWDQIRAVVGARTSRETRAWVKGYIVALEDVIKDLGDHPIFAVMRERFEQSLASAQKTLDTINKIMEEPSDSEQGQGGAVRSSPGE